MAEPNSTTTPTSGRKLSAAEEMAELVELSKKYQTITDTNDPRWWSDVENAVEQASRELDRERRKATENK